MTRAQVGGRGHRGEGGHSTRERIRAYVAWVRQGRPRHMPVVLKVGTMQILPNGRMIATGFVLCGCYMDTVLYVGYAPNSDDDDTMALWEHLTKFTTPEWRDE